MSQVFAVRSAGTVALLSLGVLSIAAEAAAPRISGAPTTSTVVGQNYAFQPRATDADGNRLTYTIANRPAWASFSSTTGKLWGTPYAEHARVWSGIVISVSDGTSKVSLPAYSLTVKPNPNKSPVLTGTPVTTAKVGVAYSFQLTAKDPEGKALTFSIRNKPTWATFSTSTGKLSGTPTVAGTFASIMIIASDGVSSASLPLFSITAAAAATNAAPTISGAPAKTAQVGVPYSFKPVAADANKDALTFSIENKPSWLTFSATTGQLSGTPTTAGATGNILIRVSDGKATASLAAFTITVAAAPPVSTSGTATLSWTPPTTYTDGSTMSNLAGYRIHYGQSRECTVIGRHGEQCGCRELRRRRADVWSVVLRGVGVHERRLGERQVGRGQHERLLIGFRVVTGITSTSVTVNYRYRPCSPRNSGWAKVGTTLTGF